jgi:predicted PurR-regulated permease PerM
MSRTSKTIIVIVVICLLLVGWAYYILVPKAYTYTVSLISASPAPPLSLLTQIQPGTSRHNVIEFLNKHGIRNDSETRGARDEVYAYFLGVDLKPLDLVSRNVIVTFKFNHDKLSKYTTKQYLMGP